MKAYILDLLREIKKSLGRFCSILAIVAIGTAFFAGVKASVPDMLHTADQYFKDYNMQDIRLVSTMGFSKEDVSAISKVKGIQGIMPTHTSDFLTHRNTTQLVVKAISLPSTNEKDPNYINHVRLVSGRMPKNEQECLVEEQGLKNSGYQIGDRITLESGSEQDIDDVLKHKTFKIVGTAYYPEYLSFNKGSSTIGNGSVDLFILIDDQNYKSQYYSEVLVTVKDSKNYDSYSEEYFKFINPVVTSLTQVGDDRSEIRFQELKKMATKKLSEGKKQYEQAKLAYETKIKEAQAKLESAKDELLLGQASLTSNKLNFESTQTTLKLQIAQNEAMLQQYQTQLDEIVQLQQQANEQLDPLITKYEQQKAQANTKLTALKQQLQDPTLSELEQQRIQLEIQLLETSIQEYSKQVDQALTAKQTMDAKITTFQDGIKQAQNKVVEGKQQLEDSKQIANQEFAKAQEKLDAGNKQYLQGKQELEKNKKIGEEELLRAKEQLEASEAKLKELPQPSWYVLDRNSHYAYRDYQSVTQRMEGIAKVFPLFFLVVCALVCLTTMTRMVDEQRGIIGTYKALGYGNAKIVSKYVVYACSAGILGSILGCVVGMVVFPLVIFHAWNLMYNLPELEFVLQLPLALSSSLVLILVSVLATLCACYKELKEVPALLMRPKAPKNGKSIFLEHIPFIWNRFSFSHKVCARNIFRYKKRFFMTIIGVSGCSALLVAGFGIKDSIRDVVHLQYDEIMNYDALVSYQVDASLQQQKDLETMIKKDSQVQDYAAIHQSFAKVRVDNEEQSVSLVVPKDCTSFHEFVNMRDRKSQEALNFSSDGAIVSEKLAMNLHKKVNDTISIVLEDGTNKEVKITGIMENYVGHAMYLTPSYYKQLTHEIAAPNAMYVNLKEVNANNQQAFSNRYMKLGSIQSLTFYDGIAKRFEDTISSLNFVIYVLIAAAGLLAFVVLYNLTNVNISERVKEIATIKVLGFYPKEVSSYVYRENIVLTFIGGLLGLVLGIGLHALIMNLAEMPEIMFGRNIVGISFVYSMLLTLCFAMIVNLVMYKKLQSIPMVESLKSVE